MTDNTYDAQRAKNTLLSALGHGGSDAVLLSSDQNGPSLWTSGLKKAVFGVVAASIAFGAVMGAQSIGQSVQDQISGPQQEISLQVNKSSIEKFANQIGPQLFSKGGISIEIGETDTEPSARFFTAFDPGDKSNDINQCYAVYQPALKDALGSSTRLENTMEVFALAHCMTAGRNGDSVSNIVGKADFGRVMTNLAMARLIEGNVLGEDGRDLNDKSSVRDAWFASQFSQKADDPTAINVDGIVSFLVLQRAGDTLAMYKKAETVSEFKNQSNAVVDDALEDFRLLFRELKVQFPGNKINQVNDALQAVYNSSSPEARLREMNLFMQDPAKATEQIQNEGIGAYLGIKAAPSLLDSAQINDPFGVAPDNSLGKAQIKDPFDVVPVTSLEKVQIKDPFDIAPQTDADFEDGPGF